VVNGTKGWCRTMDLESCLVKRARHEACHAAYAVSCAFEVESVAYHPHGKTVLLWPYAPWKFYTRYKENPITALDSLRQILGTLCAPYVILRDEPAGVDADILGEWASKWSCYRLLTNPEGPTWEALVESVHWQVFAWSIAVGRKQQLDYLTEALLQHGRLDGVTWKVLYDQCAPPPVPTTRARYVY
jgi:hypothetical protein